MPRAYARARRSTRLPAPRCSRLAASSSAREHGHRREKDRGGLDRVRRSDQQTGQQQPVHAHPAMRDPDDREGCGGGQQRGRRIGRDRAHHGTPLGIRPRPPATVTTMSGSDVTVVSSRVISHVVPSAMSSDTSRSRRSAWCPVAGAACRAVLEDGRLGAAWLHARARIEDQGWAGSREAGRSQHGRRADVVERLLHELVRRGAPLRVVGRHRARQRPVVATNRAYCRCASSSGGSNGGTTRLYTRVVAPAMRSAAAVACAGFTTPTRLSPPARAMRQRRGRPRASPATLLRRSFRPAPCCRHRRRTRTCPAQAHRRRRRA